MPAIEARFKLENETKGALRYQEVDEKGKVIEQAWASLRRQEQRWQFPEESVLRAHRIALA
jgi:hypothetical protein